MASKVEAHFKVRLLAYLTSPANRQTLSTFLSFFFSRIAEKSISKTSIELLRHGGQSLRTQLLLGQNQYLVPTRGTVSILNLYRIAMSLVLLSNVCSHLQNASKARLGLTSVPSTNMILTLTLALQQSGFLSSVTRGGLTPPPLDSLSSYVSEPVTQENIATRRLWLGLKYWNNDPVLSKMNMISKPTKRVWMNAEGLGKIVRGRDANYVKGLTRPGECLFVSTDRGILEARECAEKKVGGMLLCRVL